MYFKCSCHHARIFLLLLEWQTTRFYVVFEIGSLAHMLSSWIGKNSAINLYPQSSEFYKVTTRQYQKAVERWKQSSSKSLTVLPLFSFTLPLFNTLALWNTWKCVWTHIAIMEFQCKGQTSDESMLQLRCRLGELESSGGSVCFWNMILVEYPWLWRGC